MSELRERVARAIYAVVNDEEHWASEAAWLRADYRSKADAAIAAYDETTVFVCSECGGMGTVVGKYDADDAAMTTDPTEAEIEAAKTAYDEARENFIEHAKQDAVCRGTDGDTYPDCVQGVYHDAFDAGIRAAIFAARTAAS